MYINVQTHDLRRLVQRVKLISQTKFKVQENQFFSDGASLEMRGYGSVRLRLVTVIAKQPTASQRLVMVGYGWLFLKNRITDHLNSILEIIVISSRTKDFINKQIRRTETCNICIFQTVSYSRSFQNGSRFPIA